MKTLLGIIISCITLFLFVAVRPVSANHLCGQDCNQFTDQGACTHGCTVPGAQQNPDYRSADSYVNAETQQAQRNAAASNEATAAIVIQQAVAAGVDANIAVQVLETQYGVTNAQAALDALNQLDAVVAAANIPTGCQGAGCCLVGNCGSGQYCAGADAGRNQYGRCVEGDNKPRSGTDIAKAFIDVGGSSVAVTANPLAFLGEIDYDKMQGKNGQTVTSLESILSGIKGVVNTAAGTTVVSDRTPGVPEAIDCIRDPMKCGSSCAGGVCGTKASGAWFCAGPTALATKTCNQLILEYTGSYVYAYSPNECNLESINEGQSCFVTPTTLGWDGRCFAGGTNTFSTSNYCANAAAYAGIACSTVNESNSAQNCLDRTKCGLQQIDSCKQVESNGTKYWQCAYVSVVSSQANCVPPIPSAAPVITSRQPSFRPPTTSSTPPSSPTPPQSPPPPGSPVCVGETSSISAPQLGQSPVFTCTPASQATRYEFQWKLGSGAYQSLAPSATGSNVSTPLLVNSSGIHTIQCRPCNANGCANWDNL